VLCWVWVRVSEREGWDGGGRVVVDVKREPSIRRAFNGCTENKQLPDRVLDWPDWLDRLDRRERASKTGRIREQVDRGLSQEQAQGRVS
jgi:hypothetical protein